MRRPVGVIPAMLCPSAATAPSLSPHRAVPEPDGGGAALVGEDDDVEAVELGVRDGRPAVAARGGDELGDGVAVAHDEVPSAGGADAGQERRGIVVELELEAVGLSGRGG